MADNERYAEDIAQLWGPREEAAVEPPADLPALDASPTHSPANGSTNGNGNGSHAGGLEPEQDVARLADAIAHRRLGTSRADLEALRTDLENTFAQQLAVGLYELMTTSNERLATFEEHMNRQLDGVREAFGEQVRQVTASIDSHHVASAREFEALRAKLGAVEDDLAGPVESGAALQQEMRQEIGRLGDLLSEQADELARRSQAEASSLVETWAELSAAGEENAAGVARVGAEMGALSEQVTKIQADVAELRRVVADLGATVAGLNRPVSRHREVRRRRGWSSAP